MRFRPCIDIHNGRVKQIVGGSLKDDGGAKENFVSEVHSDFYAKLYKKNGLKGGHIILLNKAGTEEYESTKKEAILALNTYRDGMQIGGGITADNAKEFIEAGASHVIVTSYIFTDGKLDYDKLNALVNAIGKEHIVLDLSCRKREDSYYVVVDRWQTFTDTVINPTMMTKLSEYCDEFLIHGVDVEGKKQGIDEELLRLLAQVEAVPVTYAGGVRDMSDIERIEILGKNRIDFTVGSALDIFGGSLSFEQICEEVQ